MHQDQIEPLIEAIYDAAVDPEGWTEVMALVRQCFSTGAETLYYLDYTRRSMRPVHVSGIADRFLQSFETCFYTEDNPSTRTKTLHRPGVIRTDQCLVEYFRDADILRRLDEAGVRRRWQGLCHGGRRPDSGGPLRRGRRDAGARDHASRDRGVHA